MIKPTGYYVLVELEPIEKDTKSQAGIILATSKDEDRYRNAQCIGTIIEFGPLAFKGLQNGCNTPEEWGVSVGNKVEFNSYDGKIPKSAGGKDLRLIVDQHIICKVAQ